MITPFYRLLIVTLLGGLVVSQASAQQATESVLRAGDSIVVKLSGVPAEEIAVVSTSYDIADNGSINLPYIGEVRAAGVRPSTLQKHIESAYKNAEIFTHPTIQVTPNREAATQVIYVSGEVRAPGRISLTPGMTIHDAITSAGGPTEFAGMKKVKFTRGGQTREVDLRRADGAEAATQAQPGDRIHVPQ
jgi:protein involved in polysaccharide export with SLBB domain